MKPFGLIGAIVLLMLSSVAVIADEGNGFHARLRGFNETPSILTTGTGTFSATPDPTGTQLSFTLTFSGLSSPAIVAHIHFAQKSVAGSVVAFLCGGGGKAACPSGGGTVTDTIMASDVLAVPSQGVNAGSFSDFLAVLRSGDAYVNVHTTDHPAGEIRGQIRAGEGDD